MEWFEAFFLLGFASLVMISWKILSFLTWWLSETCGGKLDKTAQGFKSQVGELKRANKQLQEENDLLRSQLGEKHQVLDLTKSVVYVTNSGARYHTDLGCGSLKNHGCKPLQPCLLCCKKGAKKSP